MWEEAGKGNGEGRRYWAWKGWEGDSLFVHTTVMAQRRVGTGWAANGGRLRALVSDWPNEKKTIYSIAGYLAL
jgi:hypothetical protein